MITVPGRTRVDIEKRDIELMSSKIRQERDEKINAVAWRIERWNRETLLEIPHHDDLVALQVYIQQLCDIPNQQGFPQHVEWPVYGGEQ